MSKIQLWSLIIGVVIVLSIIYPVSVYASYYSSNNQVNSSHVPFAGAISQDIFTDPKETQNVAIWSTYTSNEAIQAHSNVILFAINVNYTKIPPFAVYGSSNSNASISYLGTLSQFNLTIDLTIKNGVYIVKQISDTISLNNKTKTLSVTKVFTWQPPVPGLVDLINPLSQKTYSLRGSIVDLYYLTNTSHQTSIGSTDWGSTIYLKWINFNILFTIYSIFIISLVLVVTGIYTGNEYRKYTKIKDKNGSFLVYLRNNFQKYTITFRKTRKQNTRFKPQTISNETLAKLEQIEKENSPDS